LHILGLDLRHLLRVQELGAELARSLPALDLLVHNAAATIHRPVAFYAGLQAREQEPLDHSQRPLLEGGFLVPEGSSPVLFSELAPVASSASLLPGGSPDFPLGKFEDDGQQLDLRERNSWLVELGDVSPEELVEAHAVSSLAPFLLTQSLLPALKRSSLEPAVVVNVSAMEASFSRHYKSPTHPHTNMAKAGLNMLTRTAGPDLVADGIAMVSVDTGWVTDENPHPVRERSRQERGFRPPLDEVDGAARVTAPIFQAARGEGVEGGVFLKDFRKIPW
jgi:NAD(P)-dependent dehydrogenase (short-subunit alcohol dehydrogenase family)